MRRACRSQTDAQIQLSKPPDRESDSRSESIPEIRPLVPAECGHAAERTQPNVALIFGGSPKVAHPEYRLRVAKNPVRLGDLPNPQDVSHTRTRTRAPSKFWCARRW